MSLPPEGSLAPAELNRIYGRLGVKLAYAVSTTVRAIMSSSRVADLARARLAVEMKDDRDQLFSFVEREEIWAGITSSVRHSNVPRFFRSFYACLLLSGELGHIAAEVGRLPPRFIAEMYFAVRWAASGLPVFSLTHGLTAALLLTEAPAFEAENFHLPFEAFSILLPAGILPMVGKEESCEMVNVHLFETVDDDGVTKPMIEVDVRSRKHSLVHRQSLEKLSLSVERDQQADWGEFELVEDDYRTIEAALRLVRNLAAWLQAYDRDEPEGTRKKAARKTSPVRDPSSDPVPTTWIIGREVKLSPELRRIAAEVALGHKHGGPGWKLRQKFVVTGHWRWQAHGKQWSERKRIWIMPFWKGPEGAAAWSHVFVVDDGKEH